jgi:hypothetical protein
MDIDAWLAAAVADAGKRGLPELKPLLESVANSTRALRGADWCDRADGGTSDIGRAGMDIGRRTSDSGLDRNRP